MRWLPLSLLSADRVERICLLKRPAPWNPPAHHGSFIRYCAFTLSVLLDPRDALLHFIMVFHLAQCELGDLFRPAVLHRETPVGMRLGTSFRELMRSEKGEQRPYRARSGRTGISAILLKNSNFRGDHNSEDRWQPRWKFPWGLSGATDLSAYDALLALAVASTRGDNAFRAEVGFSRHLNFRLFQQYQRNSRRSVGSANGPQLLD